jgi:hypothetical protein
MRFKKVFFISFLLFCLVSLCVFFFRSTLAFMLSGYPIHLINAENTEAFEAFRNTLTLRMVIFRCGLGMAVIQLLLTTFTLKKHKEVSFYFVWFSLLLSVIVTLLLLTYLIQGLVMGSGSV